METKDKIMQYLLTQSEMDELKKGTPLDKLAGQIQQEIDKLENTYSGIIDEFSASRPVLSSSDTAKIITFVNNYVAATKDFATTIRNLTFKENPMDKDLSVK